jgi:hypothetical protein
MSERSRSFFTTTTGLVTGLAALLTAVVGFLTVGTQLGWLGGGGDGPATTTTVAGTGAGGVATTAAGPPTFTVEPSRVTFEALGQREVLVTVRNNGTSAITWRPFTMSGPDAAAFSVTDVSCLPQVAAGRSCEVRVRFAPPRSGDYAARLVVEPQGGTAREVDVTGRHIL